MPREGHDRPTRSYLRLSNCAGLPLSSTRGASGGNQSMILCAERTAGAFQSPNALSVNGGCLLRFNKQCVPGSPNHGYFLAQRTSGHYKDGPRPSSKRLSSSRLRCRDALFPFRQCADNGAQYAIPDGLCCLGSRQPLHLAFSLL
jgi:hypothetical protein